MRNKKTGFTPLEIKRKSYNLSQRLRSKDKTCVNIKSGLRSDISSELSLTGFTLMELLVVIAIITMLAGMIFPTLGKARIRARKAKAIAELKTIELALMDYYTEYSGFPTNRFKTPPGTNGLDKLAAEEYLDTTLKDPFDSNEIYQYYSCKDDALNGGISGEDLADSCIVFSVGPNENDVNISNFDDAHADAYPGGTEPGSDNIYLIVPVEDIRYKK